MTLEGYDVRVAEDGRAAIAQANEWKPELILLDLMLPGRRRISGAPANPRQGETTSPSSSSRQRRRGGQGAGFVSTADQYVTKPFGILELLERVAALLRRSARGAEGPPSTLAFGSVTVDLGSRAILRDGHPVALTPKAYELLLALVRREGVVASRTELLKEVWGYGAFIMTRTVDSHVAELRRKLDDPTNPRHIITVWKVGHRFVR